MSWRLRGVRRLFGPVEQQVLHDLAKSVFREEFMESGLGFRALSFRELVLGFVFTPPNSTLPPQRLPRGLCLNPINPKP